MITEPNILPLERKDLIAFIEFRRIASKESEYINELTKTEAEEIINNYNVSGGRVAYVLINNNKIIGQLFIDIGIKSKEKILCLLLISVLKQFEGHGYGKRLISFALKLAKENKLNTVELIVDKNNLHAIKFYERLGFKYIKTFDKTNLVYQKILLEKSNLMTEW